MTTRRDDAIGNCGAITRDPLAQIPQNVDHARIDVFVVNPKRCHIVLAEIIAAHVGVDPAEVQVSRDANGKPYVLGGPPFSLSHSGEVALLAIGESTPVGVDVEQIKVDRQVERLAQRVFSSYERNALGLLPREQLVEAFYWCWTAKEAYVKALGEGLRRSFASFDVSVDLTAPPVLLSDRQTVSLYPWTLCRLAVPDGYAATLAVGAASCDVQTVYEKPSGFTTGQTARR